ncbi:MAG TPA: CARDB domain-containing protein [Longimicrobiales bacterium]|nr:CARDB domain-containing protein [Longimicrobiales bacterium]
MVVSFRSSAVRHIGVLASLLVLPLAWSCGGSDGTGPETPRPTSLVLTPTTATLTYVGASTTLRARILDQNGGTLTGTVTWSSDAPEVATVSSSGTVKAVKNGSANITASSGNLTAAATITVQQSVVSLAVVSGNLQSAIAGEALAETVVVRAKDAGDTGVPGVTVTFTPAQGSGSVSPASAATDANGDASTVWTLGDAFGPQGLSASIQGGPSASVTAKSLSPVPLPDLVAVGSLLVQRPDPSTLDTVQVQVTVRNDGDAAPGQGVEARLLLDGAVIGTKDLGTIAAGAEQALSFTVGPFATGAHELRFEVDPENAIEELIESNNVLTKSVPVVLLTVISPGTITGLGAVEDTELLYRLDLPGAANNLTVELSGGTGDVDLFLEAGSRPSNRDDYNDCQSGSPTTVERCQLAGVTAGSYYILLHAFTTFSGTTMTISLDGEVLPFNIEVVFIDHGSAAQDAAIIEAAERWMSLIPLDITDSDFSAQPLDEDDCFDGAPAVSDIVDDIRIYVSIDSIDGPSGTLGQAGPCIFRGLGHLPILGYMQFDSADMVTLEQRGELLPVVLHEMGHVLGFGTVWPLFEYLKNPSLPSNSGADTYFDGPGAVAAFDAAGGTAYTGGGKVPVENVAGEGSSDSHWRESALGTELMTPYFNSGRTNPLSAITLKSLQDIGYQVDASLADPYSATFTAPSPVAGATEGITLDLSGDVLRRPIVLVDQKGRRIPLRR